MYPSRLSLRRHKLTDHCHLRCLLQIFAPCSGQNPCCALVDRTRSEVQSRWLENSNDRLAGRLVRRDEGHARSVEVVPARSDAGLSPERLPRRIFVFWDKGLESAPEIVRYCASTWLKINPGWTVEVLDQAAAEAILPRKSLPAKLKIAHYADILPTKLLHDRGGVWVDATCLCLAPLNSWLLPVFNQTDFFCFYRPGSDRLVSNWFLASTQRGVLISEWNRQTTRFWARRQRRYPPYFGTIIFFEYMVRRSRKVRKAWTPFRS